MIPHKHPEHYRRWDSELLPFYLEWVESDDTYPQEGFATAFRGNSDLSPVNGGLLVHDIFDHCYMTSDFFGEVAAFGALESRLRHEASRGDYHTLLTFMLAEAQDYLSEETWPGLPPAPRIRSTEAQRHAASVAAEDFHRELLWVLGCRKAFDNYQVAAVKRMIRQLPRWTRWWLSGHVLADRSHLAGLDPRLDESWEHPLAELVSAAMGAGVRTATWLYTRTGTAAWVLGHATRCARCGHWAVGLTGECELCTQGGSRFQLPRFEWNRSPIVLPPHRRFNPPAYKEM